MLSAARWSLALAFFLGSGAAFAQAAPPAPVAPASSDTTETKEEPRDFKRDVPLIGYTISAFGAPARTLGAEGYGGVLGHTVDTKPTSLMGGGRIWGSPIDRLTIFVEGTRREFGDFAPVATATVRIAGDHQRGWAVGASVSYKAEGFDDLGGEIEGGAMLSVETRRLHLDSNFVVGSGFDESEADGEFKCRAGYDIAPWLRAGFDGRFRVRLAGDTKLPGNRLGDLIVGPEVVLGYQRFFFAATGGPSTVGVASKVGWFSTGTVGVLVL